MEFRPVEGRKLVGDFDAGTVSTDGGALLLREADLAARIISRFAACFDDKRDPKRITHSLESLLRQRVHGLALGYEDVVDHETLRNDPVFCLLAEQADTQGSLAGKSTLNRLEVSASEARRKERYHKISFYVDRFHALLRELFFEAHAGNVPGEVVLDIDATDLPLHGQQEGRKYNGYYHEYVYLPLYIFCGDHVLHAGLRTAEHEAAHGSLDALQPIIASIRHTWPNTRIIVRGDSGFCRDDLMSWCEANRVDFILGLAKNKALLGRCDTLLKEAEELFQKTQKPARIYTGFNYKTGKTWSRMRRVVAKCEHIEGKSNPRFIVTTIPSDECKCRALYERAYCPRGCAEQRIGEQMELFADRPSCHAFASNQLRLALSTTAYTLIHRVRMAMQGTELERARPETIRHRLLKVGGLVRETTRRIVLSLSSGFPWARLVQHCLAVLSGAVAPLPAIKPQAASCLTPDGLEFTSLPLLS